MAAQIGVHGHEAIVDFTYDMYHKLRFTLTHLFHRSLGAFEL